MLDILRIYVRETFEFRLVQVHQEQPIDGGQSGGLVSELGVKVGNIVFSFLNVIYNYYSHYDITVFGKQPLNQHKIIQYTSTKNK